MEQTRELSINFAGQFGSHLKASNRLIWYQSDAIK